MKDIVHSNITQCQFGWAELDLQPIPELSEIGIAITPLPEPAQEQEQWWNNLEYQKIPRKPGIYAIINTLNRHFYIGSAISLYKRKGEHFRDLKANKHRNDHLQKAYNLYGTEVFRFVIVERVSDIELLIDREQHYIDTLNPDYNITRIAGSQLGYKHSDEARASMSASKKGKPAHNRGITHSEEARRKLSKAHKGKKRKPLSDTHKANISAAQKGREFTDEHRTNLSAAHKGKKRGPHSDETKENISAALKGKPLSEEHKEKMRGNTNGKGNKGGKGKPLSPESIAKREATKRAKRAIDPTYDKRNKGGKG